MFMELQNSLSPKAYKRDGFQWKVNRKHAPTSNHWLMCVISKHWVYWTANLKF